jgi:hypothetical protein
MEEGINPTNTMGSFYQATFLLNASVFIALELNKRLNILWTRFKVPSTSILKLNSTANTPVLTVGFEPTF